MTTSLSEQRKLREIFEALDEGNPKIALNRVNAVLKKHPDSISAKSVKALTLQRLDQREEALALAESVRDQQPTDPDILNVLLRVFTAAEAADRLTPLYALAAERRPTDESAARALFFCHVRDSNFDAQQKQLASMLSKFPASVPIFSLWRVASMYVQAKMTASPKLMSLCEAVISRIHDERKILKPHDAEFFVAVLAEQGKWPQVAALTAPDSPVGKLFLVQEERAAIRADALLKSGQFSAARDEFASLLKNPAALLNWDHFIGYIEATMKLVGGAPDLAKEAKEFISSLEKVCGPEPNKGPLLAIVELEKRLSPEPGPMMAALAAFVSKFGSKPSCGIDVRPFAEELVLRRKVPPVDVAKALEAALEPLAGATPDEGVRKKAVLFVIRRMLGLHQQLDAPAAISLANEMAVIYADAVTRDPPKDGAPSSADELVLLCYATLVDFNARTGNVGVLYDAASLLESVLAQNPNNCQARLCLIEVYKRLGAVKSGQVHFWDKSLGIRNVLIETCCHLFIGEPVRHLDIASASSFLCDASLALHHDNRVQLPDQVIQAYLKGSYLKAAEFSLFRRRFSNSSLLVYSRTESALLALLKLPVSEAVKVLGMLPSNTTDAGTFEGTEFLGDKAVFLHEQWDPIVDAPAQSRIPLFLQPQSLALQRQALRVLIASTKPTEGAAMSAEVQALVTAIQKAGIAPCEKESDISVDSLAAASWALFSSVVQMSCAGSNLMAEHSAAGRAPCGDAPPSALATFNEKFAHVNTLVIAIGKTAHADKVTRQRLPGFLADVGACISQGVVWCSIVLASLQSASEAIIKRKKHKGAQQQPQVSGASAVRDRCRAVQSLIGSLAQGLSDALVVLSQMQPHDGVPETIFSQQLVGIISRRDTVIRDVTASHATSISHFQHILASYKPH